MPGGSGGISRDLETAGQVAGALAGDGDGVLACVHAEVVAAELPRQEPAGPADSAAEVEHRDAAADGRLLRELPDLGRAHEALLLDVLAGAECASLRVRRPTTSTNRCMPVTVLSLGMLERGATLRAGRRPLPDLGKQVGPLAGLVGTVLLLAVLARTVGIGGAGWFVGLASGLALNLALARALWRDPSAGLGWASWVTLTRATLAVGVAALTAASFELPVATATLVTLASDRARARFRRRLARTAHGDAIGSRREAGRRGRRVPDPRAQHRGRPDGRRLGAPDRPRALRVPRGGLGVPVAAGAAAAARLAQDGDGVAGGRAGDRGVRGPAAVGEPRAAGRRARAARRVVRPRRLVAVAAPGRSARSPDCGLGSGTRSQPPCSRCLPWRSCGSRSCSPIRPWQLTAGSFARLPLEGLVLVVLALAPAHPRWTASAVGDRAAASACWCWSSSSTSASSSSSTGTSTRSRTGRYLSVGFGTVRDTFGNRDADLAIAAAAVLGLAALIVPALAVGRLTRVAARHRRRSLPAVTVLTAVWALCWVLRRPGLGRRHRVHERARTSPSTKSGRAGGLPRRGPVQSPDPPQGSLPQRAHHPAPEGTARQGRPARVRRELRADRPAGHIRSRRPSTRSSSAGKQRLQADGFSARSGWLTSPTYGGGSWLANATLQSGVWVNSPGRYSELIASKRVTLAGAFRRAGWRTVADIPADPRRLAGGELVLPLREDLGPQQPRVPGPELRFLAHAGPVRAPGLAEARAGEAEPPSRLLGGLPSSSHEPWTRVPPLISWNRLGNGSIFNRLPIDRAGLTDTQQGFARRSSTRCAPSTRSSTATGTRTRC